MAPLYEQARQTRAMGHAGSTVTQLRRTATKNVVLAFASVAVQSTFLMLTLIYEATVSTYITSLVSPEWSLLWSLEFFIVADPTVSVACCYAMTSIWRPSLWRERAPACRWLGRGHAAPSHTSRDASDGGALVVAVAVAPHKSVVLSQSSASSPANASPRPLPSP